jgi:hypothetical protein
MRVALSVLLVLLIPSLCHAWGGQGHQLVALIAVEMLTPETKAAAKELLDGANVCDAEVVNWADEVRRERRETAPWHYVNIPYDAQGFDRERDGRKGDNVIDAIDRQTAILAGKAQPREKRQEALKFVIHFIGHVHQPLHCVDRNGDKGGNGRLVFFLDDRKADSLHYVWDTALVRELVGRKKIADVADTLSKTITVKQRKEWAATAPEPWANEAHRVAVNWCYLGIAADGGTDGARSPTQLSLVFTLSRRAAGARDFFSSVSWHARGSRTSVSRTEELEWDPPCDSGE